MDRQRWGALADRFMKDLRSFDFGGRHLDVRENVRFRGAELCRFVHTNFPKTGCGLAIEFKKLDIVGDKLMEIKVFSPGGLGSAQSFEKANFSVGVIEALERKVEYMQYYRRNFDNVDMATL